MARVRRRVDGMENELTDFQKRCLEDSLDTEREKLTDLDIIEQDTSGWVEFDGGWVAWTD